MNLALVHDRLQIKSFWEERINTECQHAETEEQRRNRSSLKKSVTSHSSAHHILTATMRETAENVQRKGQKDLQKAGELLIRTRAGSGLLLVPF